MNFVCTVFELGDGMLTLLSMEKQMAECNRQGRGGGGVGAGRLRKIDFLSQLD